MGVDSLDLRILSVAGGVCLKSHRKGKNYLDNPNLLPKNYPPDFLYPHAKASPAVAGEYVIKSLMLK